MNGETQRFVLEKENIRWQKNTRKQNTQEDAHNQTSGSRHTRKT